MPIRLNLLAEVQAAEELRRRDPVKRAIWLGALLVACMLAWSSYVWGNTMVASRKLSRIEQDIHTITNGYHDVMVNQRKVEDVKRKLEQLHKLAINRFLQGNLLNGLQQATVEDVQLTKVWIKQEYLATDEVKGKTNTTDGRVLGFKPATAKETITITLEAKDSSPNAGDQVNPYKDTISTNAFFQTVLGRTNEVRLNSVSPPTQPGPNDIRTYRTFTLESRLPEKIR